jgi:3-oxoacyl-[acyl-carrier protein] reductase
MRLNGKRAIITGAASGFGAGIAKKFIEEGAEVIIADLNEKMARKVAIDLGERAYPFLVDVSKSKSVEKLKDFSLSHFGIPDIIVNNAGITHTPDALENISEDDFDKVFFVNCKSVYLMAQLFVPEMKEQKSGVFLNVASTAGVSPRPNLNWYNASKGWMNTATKTMAIELALHGIRVNAINPVAGETPLLATFMGEDTPMIRSKFLSTIPLGRFSTPEDMGNAACFLCSDEASMITGVCLEVDGGRCI